MKKFLALALSVIMAAGMLTALAADEEAQLTITVEPGLPYVFSQEDIADALEEGRELRGIIITALPDSGVLTYGGRKLYAGEGILASGLGGLSYTSEGKNSQFTFLAVYYDGTAADSTTVRLRTKGTVNAAPVAEDMTIDTYKGISRTCAFAASDEDGDTLTFRIVSQPSKGTVTINQDGTFTYTPNEGKSGRDTFIYTATDVCGETSREALVTVNISRKAPRVSYGDMSDNTASYEAARLAEEGIFVGEQVNGQYYFGPDKPVSRGEFVAMSLKACGLDPMSVSATGFVDDASTAAWQKNYIATAQLAGIVNGIDTEAGKVFQAARAVTGKEAAHMVCALMGFESSGVIETAALEADWAAVSVMALQEADFLSQSAFGDEPLTRAEAARILVEIMDYQ